MLTEEEKDTILNAVITYLSGKETLEIALKSIIAYCQDRLDGI